MYRIPEHKDKYLNVVIFYRQVLEVLLYLNIDATVIKEAEERESKAERIRKKKEQLKKMSKKEKKVSLFFIFRI